MMNINLQPSSSEKYSELDSPEPEKGLSLFPVFSGEMFRRVICYPLIVEMWHKKDSGRNKRRWLAEFSQTERDKISEYYGRFYKWYLVTGTPRRVALKLQTLQLLERAVSFFGELT